MRLSVIIPCFNAGELFRCQLEALSLQTWNSAWEIIVADNGSTDQSVAIAEEYRESKLPNLRIIDASARRGGSYAINAAAKVAKGDALALCDADDEVAPNWVAAMGDALAEWDFVAGCCDLKKLNETWAIKARFGGRDQDTWAHGLLQSKLSPLYPFASSCNLGVKKSIHKIIGGFDESLLTCYDAEYCRRAQIKGISLQYIPDAVVHYRLRDTLMGIYKQAYSYSKYRVLIYDKYKSTDVFSRPLKDGVMAWKLLAKGFLKIRNKADLALWLNSLGWRMGYEHGISEFKDKIC